MDHSYSEDQQLLYNTKESTFDLHGNIEVKQNNFEVKWQRKVHCCLQPLTESISVGLLVDKPNTHNTYKCRYAINYSLSASRFNITTLCAPASC